MGREPALWRKSCVVTTETHGDGRLPPAAAALPCRVLARPRVAVSVKASSASAVTVASLAAPVALDPRGAQSLPGPAPDKGRRLEVKSRRCRRRTLQEANSARGPVLPEKPLSGADERVR